MFLRQGVNLAQPPAWQKMGIIAFRELSRKIKIKSNRYPLANQRRRIFSFSHLFRA